MTRSNISSPNSSQGRPGEAFLLQRIQSVHYLRLQNFKQFRNNKKVGPFDNFTALVGANGSGKSSVFEAIGFVLAIRHKRYSKDKLAALRSFGVPASKECSVEMVCLTKDGNILYLKRQITGQDGDILKINSQEVEKEVYRDFIQSQGLNCMVGSFWLNQNMMDEMCMKTGTELRNLFEDISGSSKYKEDYEGRLKQVTDIKQQISENREDLRTLRKALKDSKGHISNGNTYRMLEMDFDELTIAKTLAEILDMDIRKKTAAQNKVYIEQEIQDKEKYSRQLTVKLRKQIVDDSQNTKLREAQEEFQSSKKRMASLIEQKLQKVSRQRQLQTASSSLETTISLLRDQAQQAFDQKNQIEAKILEVKDAQERVQSVRDFEGQLKTVVESFLSESRQRQEYSEERLRNKIREVQDRIGLKEQELSTQIHEIESFGNQLSISKLKKEALLRELGSVTQSKDRTREQLATLQSKYENLDLRQARVKELTNELDMIDAMKARLTVSFEDSRSDRELVNHLFSNVTGFRGVFGDLVKPIDERFRLARSILLGKSSSYLVVDTARAAELVNDILRERFVQKTVIVLEKMRPPKKSRVSEFRQKVASFGTPAFDIVYAEDKDAFIEPVITYFLMDKVCSENLDKAQKLRELLGRRANIVTISGDQIRGNCMSGVGDQSKFAGSDKTRKEIQDTLNKLEMRSEEVKEELKTIIGDEDRQKVQAYQKRLEELKLAERKLEVEIELQTDKITSFSSSQNSLSNSSKMLEVDISSLRMDLTPLEEEYDLKKSERLKNEETILKQILKKNKIKEQASVTQKVLFYLQEDYQNQFQSIDRISMLQTQLIGLNMESKTGRFEEAKAKKEQEDSSLKECTADISELNQRIQDVDSSLQKYQQSIEQSQKQVRKQKDDDLMIRTNLRAIGDQIDSYRARERRLAGEIAHCESVLKQVVSDVDIEGIELPMVEETGEYDYSILAKRLQNGKDAIAIEELEVEDNLDGPLLKSLLNPKASSTLKEEMAKKFDQASREMNKHCSKFFSDDFIDKEAEKTKNYNTDIKKLVNSQKSLVSEEERANGELQKVKNLRNEKLSSFVISVNIYVREMYYKLTGDARAYAKLYLENEDDACSGQLKYEATPPSKKFVFDSSTLSGGERVVASLALFFSINEALKSPFLLLDEADSPFDPVNASIYGACLRKFAAKRQCLLISHNFHVFSKAVMLLGIADGKKDKGASCFSYKLQAMDQTGECFQIQKGKRRMLNKGRILNKQLSVFDIINFNLKYINFGPFSKPAQTALRRHCPSVIVCFSRDQVYRQV